MAKFIVNGKKRLEGEVIISGSKNAALPIIAASLMIKGKVVLNNIPEIADIYSMISLLSDLGVKCEFKNNTLIINAEKLEANPLLSDQVKKMRASILLLGPLLARKKTALLAFPGGCVLGKRPIDVHTYSLSRLGCKFSEKNTEISAEVKRLKGNFVVLPETSVTATENVICAAVLAQGSSSIRLAASEPHVQDLCHFLNQAGAKISGIGTSSLEIEGVEELNPIEYTVTSDYIETGTMAIAATLTRGEVRIKNAHADHLDVFWSRLREVGGKLKIEGKDILISEPEKNFKPIRQLRTAVYPGFPTDLQAPFTVLLTQAEGTSSVFETLFEGRLNYLFELEKMGAQVNLLNPHQAEIYGPRKLKGTEITSCDIRAGAAMVLASLIAEGTTEISNINYIDRGYECLEKKLKKLGAEIKRID